MKHRPIPTSALPNQAYERTKLQIFIEEFINSDDPAWEIEMSYPEEYSSDAAMYHSIRAAIIRFGFAVHVQSIKGRIYLVRNSVIMK